MKRMQFATVIGLTLITLIFASAQQPRSVQVTTQTLARQSRGRPYVIDLTRKGMTYTVAASVAGRVRIHTPKGDMVMTELLSKLGVTRGRFLAGTKFLVGTFGDLSAKNFGRPLATRMSATARSNGLTCGPDICSCNPDIDGDCDERKLLCDGPMVCYRCDGPDCPPAERERGFTCICMRA